MQRILLGMVSRRDPCLMISVSSEEWDASPPAGSEEPGGDVGREERRARVKCVLARVRGKAYRKITRFLDSLRSEMMNFYKLTFLKIFLKNHKNSLFYFPNQY